MLATLTNDPEYRLSIARQNFGYNQPPHNGFSFRPCKYLPDDALPSDAAHRANADEWRLSARALIIATKMDEK